MLSEEVWRAVALFLIGFDVFLWLSTQVRIKKEVDEGASMAKTRTISSLAEPETWQRVAPVAGPILSKYLDIIPAVDPLKAIDDKFAEISKTLSGAKAEDLSSIFENKVSVLLESIRKQEKDLKKDLQVRMANFIDTLGEKVSSSAQGKINRELQLGAKQARENIEGDAREIQEIAVKKKYGTGTADALRSVGQHDMARAVEKGNMFFSTPYGEKVLAKLMGDSPTDSGGSGEVPLNYG